MITIDIPGFGKMALSDVVFDYNGTLAVDGALLPGVAEKLNLLAQHVSVHVITADTFGKAAANLADVNCTLQILPPGDQARSKKEFVDSLNAEHTVAIGNGRNDRLMLQTAVIGIAVLLNEGVSIETAQSANILVRDILDAVDLLLQPLRLKATLRS
jgi:soluble P-type ATPase